MKCVKLLAAALAVASWSFVMPHVYAQTASEVKEEVDAYKDDVNSGIATLSSRISDLENTAKLKFKGDLRFRYEYFTQSQDDSPTLLWTPNASIPNRNRYRIRFRFGAERQFGDDVYAAFRLVTGAQTDPTSTNQTLGNEEYFKTILVDQAYMKYTPGFLGHKVDVYAGKMANILDSTAITWDGDVTPEGIAAAWKLPMQFTLKGQYMVLAENSSARDQYLTNAQLAKDFKMAGQDFHLMAGYEFVPWVSSMLATTPTGYTAVPALNSPFSVDGNGMVGNRAKGGLIPDIKMVEGMLVMKNKIGDVPLKWTFHAARNTNSFNLNLSTTSSSSTTSTSVTVASPVTYTGTGTGTGPATLTSGDGTVTVTGSVTVTGPVTVVNPKGGSTVTTTKSTKTTTLVTGNNSNADAFFAKLEIGNAAAKGDLNGAIQWGYIEPNAVLSLYSDSDSGMGYSNQKWFKADVGYMLTDALGVNLGQYAAKRVNYDILGNTVSSTMEKSSRTPMFRTQLDFLIKI